MKRILLPVLFLAPTIQYRVELGAFSFALVEPVILFVVALLFVEQVVVRRQLVMLKNPIVYLFLAITILAFVIRPWASDWKHGLSDIRDWAIPVLAFVALTGSVRRGWHTWIGVFLVLALGNSLVGIYQHMTDSFRPFIGGLASYKTGFAISPETNQLALVSYAVGFFSHPNGFASYLTACLILALAWPARGVRRLLKVFLLICLGAALFWTYAKASMVVLMLAIVLFVLERCVRSNNLFLLLLSGVLAASIAIAWLAAQLVPALLLNTLYWRVGLWNVAFEVMNRQPRILIFGNGMEVFATAAYYPQPHNLYIYLLLEYGVVGLLLGIATFLSVCWRGWKARQAGLMAREPLISALWIALLSYFVIGFVESSWIDIESRTIFLLVAACFVGLIREARAPGSVEVEGTPYVGTAIASPGYL